MELLGYFLGGLGLGIGASALYYSRLIIRLKREGYIEYPLQPPPKIVEETFMLRED